MLLTPAEAADVLGVSRATLYRLMREGRITSVMIGRARRIEHAELERYVHELREDHELGDPDAPR